MFERRSSRDIRTLDVQLAEYNNLWTEILTRLQMRERLGALSISVQGVLLGVALGARPFAAQPNTQVQLADILLLSPFVAGVLQTMLMRQVVRSALLTNYLLIDLRERITESLEDGVSGAANSSPFGWLTYANRSLRLGSTADRLLAAVEFGTPLLFSLFNLIAYVIIAEKQFGEFLLYSIIVWVFFAFVAMVLGYTAFRMHRSHTSPEEVVRIYLKAVCNRQLHRALTMIAPQIRQQETIRTDLCLGRMLIRVHVRSQRAETPYERLVIASAITERGFKFEGTYRVHLLHDLWYIKSLEETIVDEFPNRAPKPT